MWTTIILIPVNPVKRGGNKAVCLNGVYLLLIVHTMTTSSKCLIYEEPSTSLTVSGDMISCKVHVHLQLASGGVIVTVMRSGGSSGGVIN